MNEKIVLGLLLLCLLSGCVDESRVTNFQSLTNFPASCPDGFAVQDANRTSFTCVAIGGGGGGGGTYTSGTPATIQVDNDANQVSQNFDGNFNAGIAGFVTNDGNFVKLEPGDDQTILGSLFRLILEGGLIVDQNIGVGLPDPKQLIHLFGDARALMRFGNTTSGSLDSDGLAIGYDSTPEGAFFWNRENTPFYFATNNTQRWILDGNGNVRLGNGSAVTSGFRFEVTNVSGSTFLAGITEEGRLAVGLTDPTQLGHFNGDARALIRFTNSASGSLDSDGLAIGYDSTPAGAFFWNRENTPFYFATNNTERVRISPEGYFGVGLDPILNIHALTEGTSNLDSGVEGRGYGLTGEEGRTRFYIETLDAGEDEKVFLWEGRADGRLRYSSLTDDGSSFVEQNILSIFHDGNVSFGSDSAPEPVYAVGTIRTDDVFNVGGTDGLTGSVSWTTADGTYTLEYTGGLVTGVTDPTT